MKAIIISFLVSFNCYALSNGWGSSGGGENIGTKHNPWFVNTKEGTIKTIKWCINHDPRYFSLSKKEAQIEIEKGILDITEQIDRDIRQLEFVNSDNARFPFRSLLFSLQFEYQNTCENDVDLEVILGNITDPKVLALAKEHTVKSFGKIAGQAVQTEYDLNSLWAKGFIFLAADKGPLTYNGFIDDPQAKKKGIWSHFKRLNDKFSCGLPCIPNYKISKNNVSALRGVFAHELAHVYGFQHGNGGSYYFDMVTNQEEKTLSLMNELTPAKLLRKGYVRSSKYQIQKQVFESTIAVKQNNSDVTPPSPNLPYSRFYTLHLNIEDKAFQEFPNLKKVIPDNNVIIQLSLKEPYIRHYNDENDLVQVDILKYSNNPHVCTKLWEANQQDFINCLIKTRPLFESKDISLEKITSYTYQIIKPATSGASDTTWMATFNPDISFRLPIQKNGQTNQYLNKRGKIESLTENTISRQVRFQFLKLFIDELYLRPVSPGLPPLDLFFDFEGSGHTNSAGRFGVKKSTEFSAKSHGSFLPISYETRDISLTPVIKF